MRKQLAPLLIFFLAAVFMARCAALKSEGRKSPTSTTEKTIKPKGSKIADFAYRQIGTRYKYAGRDRKGFDCSGLVFYVMQNFGYNLSGGSRHQEKFGKSVSLSEVQPGDLIFFRRSKKGEVFHVAIVYANDREGIKVVHSTSSRGVVLDNISTNTYWKPKISTARRII